MTVYTEVPYPSANRTQSKQRQDALNRGRLYWGQYDSDLSDDIVMNITGDEGEKLYRIVQNWPYKEIPPILTKIDRDETIAFIRGTVGGEDWITDAAKHAGQRNNRWVTYVKRIQQFLKENRNVQILIGHSLGLALAYDAVASTNEFNYVKIVGMNGANILNSDPFFPFIRNINADSNFDKALDPWGPVETTPSYSHDISMLQRMTSVGHNSFRYEYHPHFASKIRELLLSGHTNIRTGYFDGQIRSDQPKISFNPKRKITGYGS